jgi:energy-coupling factor transport system permease protein
MMVMSNDDLTATLGNLPDTRNRHVVSGLRHPAVQGLYFFVVIVLCMSAFQPVLILIAFVSGLCCNVYLRGARAVGRSLRWQLPFVLLIAVLNPLFSNLGTTVLFTIGSRPFRLEPLVFGICMGVMLVSTVLWLSNASHVFSPDKATELLGNRAPVIGLMLSMTMRLVPRYTDRGQTISQVQRACTAAAGTGEDAGSVSADARKRARRLSYLRLISVLMGSSMEDALETSDAMRARGWGAKGVHTTYQRRRFRARDAADLVMLCLFGALCAFIAIVSCSQFEFYPVMSALVPWWGYVPYALFLFLPLLLALWDGRRRP